MVKCRADGQRRLGGWLDQRLRGTYPQATGDFSVSHYPVPKCSQSGRRPVLAQAAESARQRLQRIYRLNGNGLAPSPWLLFAGAGGQQP